MEEPLGNQVDKMTVAPRMGHIHGSSLTEADLSTTTLNWQSAYQQRLTVEVPTWHHSQRGQIVIW